jgi:hypothetical protein
MQQIVRESKVKPVVQFPEEPNDIRSDSQLSASGRMRSDKGEMKVVPPTHSPRPPPVERALRRGALGGEV